MNFIYCFLIHKENFVYSLNNKFIVDDSNKNNIKRYDDIHKKIIKCITFNENYIFSGSWDKCVSIFNNSYDFLKIIKYHKDSINCFYLLDMYLLSGDFKGNLYFFDSFKLEFQSTKKNHNDCITDISSNDLYLLTVSFDKSMAIYYKKKFELYNVLELGTNALTSVLKYDKFIFISSLDNNLRIYKNNLKFLKKIKFKDPLNKIFIFSNILFINSTDKNIYYFDLKNNLKYLGYIGSLNFDVYGLLQEKNKLFLYGNYEEIIVKNLQLT